MVKYKNVEKRNQISTTQLLLYSTLKLLKHYPKRKVMFVSSLKAQLSLAVYCFKATLSGSGLWSLAWKQNKS